MDQFYGILFYILSILVSVGINVNFCLKGENTRLFRSFLMVHFVIIIWTLGKILTMLAPNEALAWGFTCFQYLGVCFFGNAYIHFAYYYQKGKKLGTLASSALLIISLTNYLVLITNQYHHWFFASFSLYNKEYGAFFYFHTLCSYLLIGISYLYLFKGLYQNNNDMEKNKRFIIMLGLGLPLFANILHVFVLTQVLTDFTPIMFSTTFIVFGYVSYRYKFLDIRRIARYTIFENLSEGIIVADKNLRIVKFNAAINQYTGRLLKIHENMILDKVAFQLKDYTTDFEAHHTALKEFIEGPLTKKQMNIEVNVNQEIHHLILQIEKICSNRQVVKYYILRFFMVTKHKKAVEQLELKNEELAHINRALSEELSVAKKLTIAKERNRVSKELHDIIGHSLTLVISLLEVSKMMIEKDRPMAKEKITHTREIIRDGFSELKKSLSGNSDTKINVNKLVEEIEKMGNEIKCFGTHVEVVARHTGEAIEPKCYDAIYRICQEGLTNAVRHGQAQNITVGLRFSESNLDLIIADDGKGCENFTKGNGLLGMEQRIKELEGSLSCGSPDGEGFNLHIIIPRLSEELLCS